ncbi:MAG: phospholipase D-like domain-containing protein [bacterium]
MLEQLSVLGWWALAHSVSAVSVLLALAITMRARVDRRAPASTWAWILVILFVPYLGVVLFATLAGRKVRRGVSKRFVPPQKLGDARTPAQRLLWHTGHPDSCDGNLLTLLATGEAAYAEMTSLIDRAQDTISISTFVLGNDEVGRTLVERLAARARQGVTVRLMLDGVGSVGTDRKVLKQLTDAGGKLVWFMPVFRMSPGRTNLRNHRKILLCDDVAVVGGMNLAHEYIGPTPAADRWCDLSVRIEGPLVPQITRVFEADWAYATQTTAPVVSESNATLGTSELQFIAGGPDQAADPLYDALLTSMYVAEDRVWLATPYLIPDDGVFHALILAARRGVDVQILLPLRSNHRLADVARGTYVRDLIEQGVKFQWYSGPMMHAKCMLFDQTLASIGSANLDIRSLFLNYEAATFIYDAESISAVADWFELQFEAAKSQSPLKNGFVWQLGESFARLLSPML